MVNHHIAKLKPIEYCVASILMYNQCKLMYNHRKKNFL